MAHRRSVDVAIWNDERFRSWSDPGRLFFLHVLTSPLQTSIGAYRGSAVTLADELGWDVPKVEAALLEVGDRVVLDRGCRLVWVRNFLEYNPPSNENMVKGWRTAFGLLPESPLRADVLAAARAVAVVCDLGAVFDLVFGPPAARAEKPSRNRSETVSEPSDTGSETVSERFPNGSQTVPEPSRNGFETVPKPFGTGFEITDQRSEIRDLDTHRAREARPVGLMAGAARHASHAECGRVCFPEQLFGEYLETLGGDRAAADARLRGLIRAHLATLPSVDDGPVPGAADAFRYWRRVAVVEGWFGAPVAPASRVLTGPPAARGGASRGVAPSPRWVCPHHDDPCTSRPACCLRMARGVAAGTLRLEDVPEAVRDDVEVMAPAYQSARPAPPDLEERLERAEARELAPG